LQDLQVDESKEQEDDAAASVFDFPTTLRAADMPQASSNARTRYFTSPNQVRHYIKKRGNSKIKAFLLSTCAWNL
jgi:hypothetical protein